VAGSAARSRILPSRVADMGVRYGFGMSTPSPRRTSRRSKRASARHRNMSPTKSGMPTMNAPPTAEARPPMSTAK
jgi:hypothetical protein